MRLNFSDTHFSLTLRHFDDIGTDSRHFLFSSYFVFPPINKINTIVMWCFITILELTKEKIFEVTILFQEVEERQEAAN